MTHSTTWWRRDARNETDGWFVCGVVRFQKFRRVFLRRSTNLSDHDDPVCFFVFEEDGQTVDEVGSGKRVTTDADDERLAEACLCGLIDSFVGKGARAGDYAYTAAFVDKTWHDPDFTLALVMSVQSPDEVVIARRTGAIMPGQLGPTSRVLPCVLSMSVMRTISQEIQIVGTKVS